VRVGEVQTRVREDVQEQRERQPPPRTNPRQCTQQSRETTPRSRERPFLSFGCLPHSSFSRALESTMASPRLRFLLAAAILAVVMCSFSAWAAECQPSDFIGAYTACLNGRKSLIYYKDPASDCTGTINQPANVFNIPCGKTPFNLLLDVL